MESLTARNFKVVSKTDPKQREQQYDLSNKSKDVIEEKKRMMLINQIDIGPEQVDPEVLAAELMSM